MPNIKSAIKRTKSSELNRQVNASNKSRLNTARRTYLTAVETGAEASRAEASRAEAFKTFSRAIDKAAKTGVISKNAVARRKSRAFAKISSGKPA